MWYVWMTEATAVVVGEVGVGAEGMGRWSLEQINT